MEQELKKKEIKGTVVLAIIISVAIDILILPVGAIFLLFGERITECFFILKHFVILILTIRQFVFINQAHLTYGKVTKTVEPEILDDVYQDIYVEYVEENSNEERETKISKHFGDYDELYEEQIQEFFKEGQNLIGKKVPLLYKENKPKRTRVFLDEAE